MRLFFRYDVYLVFAAGILAQQGSVEKSPFQTVPPAPVVSDSLTFSTPCRLLKLLRSVEEYGALRICRAR